jgi:hypothetical protein
MKITKSKNPIRCEICHQADCFDPNKNKCKRCNEIINTEFNNSSKEHRIISNRINGIFASYFRSQSIEEENSPFLTRLALFFTFESILLIISYIFISQPALMHNLPSIITTLVFVLALPALIPEVLIIVSFGGDPIDQFRVYTFIWVFISILLWVNIYYRNIRAVNHRAN